MRYHAQSRAGFLARRKQMWHTQGTRRDRDTRVLALRLARLAVGAVLVSCGCGSEESSYAGDAEVVAARRGPLALKQEAWLEASDGVLLDRFSASVAIWGDTSVLGAPRRDWPDTGRAYVFARDAGAWSQSAILEPADSGPGDKFGSSAAIWGDTAFVGAPGMDGYIGAVYGFARTSSGWQQQCKLVAGDGKPPDFFGVSASIWEDRLVVGAPQASAAYVFHGSGGTWVKEAKLQPDPLEAGDSFGAAVSIMGDTVIVGAYLGNSKIGSAYVYSRSGDAWTQQARLTPANGIPNDMFGRNVGIWGDTAVVASPRVAAADVFVRNGSAWSPLARLTAGAGSLSKAVSIWGNNLILEAPGPWYEEGAVAIFVRRGGVWKKEAGFQSNNYYEDHDSFGNTLALAQGMAIIGEPEYYTARGQAFLFSITNGLGEFCTSNGECQTGFCVDGVCCDTPCGYDSKTDCHVCSKAAGGAEDGVCGPMPYGSGCDDGNACTQTDTCIVGSVCSGTQVTCAELDECHEVGSCDPGTGECSHPIKLDGTPCSAGTCSGGVCTVLPEAGPDAEEGPDAEAGLDANTEAAVEAEAAAGSGGQATGSGGSAGKGGGAGSFAGGSAGSSGRAGFVEDDATIGGGACGCWTANGSRPSYAYVIGLGIAVAAMRRRRP